MFKDTPDGQTHYQNDGCPEHTDELSVESLIKSRIPPNLQEVVRLIVRMEVERAKEKIMEEVDFLLRRESATQEGK